MGNLFNIDSPLMRFLTRLCDLMILNFLCMICCIPIVTIGASVTAMYTITLKMVRGEEAYILKGFFKAFKENFKQSTIIWLIMAALGLFIYFDYRATAFLPGSMKTIFQILIGAFTIVYFMVFVYILPYTARFINNIKTIFKNSLLISIASLPWTILLIVIPLGLGIVTLLTTTTLIYGSMLWLLFGFSGVAYICSIILRNVFEKYEPHDEEDEISEIPEISEK